MIELGKLIEYLIAFMQEVRKAEAKHPVFCEGIVDTDSSVSWAESEFRIKARNERHPIIADNILMEEVAEAMAAYQQGDKEHALQELAQCGAVIVRIMDFIENVSFAKGLEIGT